MVELRPVSRREIDAPEPARQLKEDAQTEDANGNFVNVVNGNFVNVVNDPDLLVDAQAPSAASSTESMEFLPLPSSQMREDMDVDFLEEEKGPTEPLVEGLAEPLADPRYGQSKMEIESGYFDQLDESDAEMIEPLLAKETLRAHNAAETLEDINRVNGNVKPDEALQQFTPFTKMTDLSTPFTKVAYSPTPFTRVADLEEVADSSATVKTEVDSDDDEFLPASSTHFQFKPNLSLSASFNKWTSSDDLNLPNLFEGPTERKRLAYYGMTGLNNLGNSCYLNSVVQCLANTRELRDYFLSGTYKREINRHNRMGTKGKFATVMEDTMRALWRGDRPTFSPSDLRDMMAQRNEQFNTYGQQDAQEAMAFIIDSLHEDLNRVTDKPYLSEIESDNRPVQEVAEQTWNYYFSRENSAIYDLFTGMFKSTVKCLECHKENIKFDPYQSISVPVPKYGVVIDCFFYPRDTKRKPLKFRMEFHREHSVSYHAPQLQSHLGDVPLSNVRILSMKNGHISSIIHSQTECSRLDEFTQFHMYEILSEENEKEKIHSFLIIPFLRVVTQSPAPVMGKPCSYCRKVPETALKRCTRCYSVSYCSSECQKGDWSSHQSQCETTRGPPVGLPFFISLRARHLTQEAFYMNVAKQASQSVSYWRYPPQAKASRTKENIPEIKTEDNESVKKEDSTARDDVTAEGGDAQSVKREMVEWKVMDSLKDMTSSAKKNTYPFKLIPLDNGLRQPWNIYPRYNTVMANAAMVQETIQKVSEYLLLWDNSPAVGECHVTPRHIEYEEDPSCQTLLNERERQYAASSDAVTLEDCISVFTRPEILTQSNAWMCPTCKKPREASKKFEIWSLPSVLVFQLKRFSKPSGEIWRRDKIETMVDYPLHSLAMQEFLVGPGDGQEYIYDLYGAVVHRGSTWYGHYVSHARCYNVPDTTSDDVQWRSFDDESVDVENNPDRVLNRGAYLLFYRRRDTPSPITIPLCLEDPDQEGEEVDDALKG